MDGTATPDGRGLVAIGCAEGVWIGFRHDSRCTFFSNEWIWSAKLPLLSVSYAAGASLENGHAVCHAGTVWYLPCIGGQGSLFFFLLLLFSSCSN